MALAVLGRSVFSRLRKESLRGANKSRKRLFVEPLESRDTPSTLTVDAGFTGSEPGFNDTKFSHIQHAIDAAEPGDRIRVFDGTYNELLSITGAAKNGIRLIAVDNDPSVETRIVAPLGTDNLDVGIVNIDGADDIRLRGFTIDGAADAGVFVDSGVRIVGGGSARIQDNIIENLFTGAAFEGFGVHVGDFIEVGGTFQETTGTADIIDNEISTYNKSGVLVESFGSFATIKGNTITGIGETDAVLQNGIDIAFDAGGVVRSNVISGNVSEFGAFGPLSATGVLLTLTDTDTTIADNTIYDNETGILIEEASGHTVRANEIVSNSFDGIALFASHENVIANNIVSGNGFLTTDPQQIVVDFETDGSGASLAAGDVIDQQFENVGFLVSTENAKRSGSPLPAMIFDTENPTGGDSDLASDELGNVLIISEDADSSDPDDKANGGTLVFDFNEPVFLDSVGFLDIEESGGSIEAFDHNGNIIADVPIAAVGDNAVSSADLDIAGVSQLKIHLEGSGAVTDLVYSQIGESDPIGVGIGLFDSSDNIVRNNEVTGNGLFGIAVARGSENRVANNAVIDNGLDGIYLEETSFNTVVNNFAQANGGNGIAVVDDIELASSPTGNVIRNNTAIDNELNGLLVSGGVDQDIRNNDLIDNGGDGIRLESTSGSDIRNNVATGNEGYGISLHDSDDNNLRNNFLFGNDEGGLFESPDSTGNTKKNNQF